MAQPCHATLLARAAMEQLVELLYYHLTDEEVESLMVRLGEGRWVGEQFPRAYYRRIGCTR